MIDQNTTKNIIATIISYIFLTLALLNVGSLRLLLSLYSVIILLWHIYFKWTFKGIDNINSYEYLWKNNKIVFLCHGLLLISAILVIIYLII